MIPRAPLVLLCAISGLVAARSAYADEQTQSEPNRQDIVFRVRGSLWAMNPDGKNRRRLTETEDGSFPFWLPGGKQVLFFSAQDGHVRSYVVNADGTGEMAEFVPGPEKFAAARKAVTDASLHLGMPDLSPDGKRIVFRNVEQIGAECPEDQHRLDLFVINADGTRLRRLTDDAASEYQARWSPDGASIVFDSTRDGYWNIYVMNADGSNRRRLTDNQANYARPVWSPDGTKIAVNSDRTGPGIYVLDANGTDLRQLTGHADDELIGGAHADWYVRPYVFPHWADFMWPRPTSRRGGPVSDEDGAAEEALAGKGAEIERDEDGDVFWVRLRGEAGTFTDADVADLVKLHWRTTRRDCRPFAGPQLRLDNSSISDDGLARLLESVKSFRSLRLGPGITDTGLAHAKALPQLEMLSLWNTQITDAGLRHLRDLPELRSVVFGYKPYTPSDMEITDAGLEHLDGLVNLTDLYLDGTKITDRGLSHLTRLTNLRHLRLTETQITDEGLTHLQGLSSLRRLNLQGTAVTEGAVDKLREALPDCTIEVE